MAISRYLYLSCFCCGFVEFVPCNLTSAGAEQVGRRNFSLKYCVFIFPKMAASRGERNVFYYVVSLHGSHPESRLAGHTG